MRIWKNYSLNKSRFDDMTLMDIRKGGRLCGHRKNRRKEA